MVRHGEAGKVRWGVAMRGTARSGKAGKAWIGTARQRTVRRGVAGKARYRIVWFVAEWQARNGGAEHGLLWQGRQGLDWLGKTRPGKAGI